MPAGSLRLPSLQETDANMAGNTSGNVDGGTRLVNDDNDAARSDLPVISQFDVSVSLSVSLYLLLVMTHVTLALLLLLLYFAADASHPSGFSMEFLLTT